MNLISHIIDGMTIPLSVLIGSTPEPKPNESGFKQDELNCRRDERRALEKTLKELNIVQK